MAYKNIVAQLLRFVCAFIIAGAVVHFLLTLFEDSRNNFSYRAIELVFITVAFTGIIISQRLLSTDSPNQSRDSKRDSTIDFSSPQDNNGIPSACAEDLFETYVCNINYNLSFKLLISYTTVQTKPHRILDS